MVAEYTITRPMRAPFPKTLRRGAFVGGRWLVGDRLGSGGMCTVFRAVDQETQRIAALKVLFGVHSTDDLKKRFSQEAFVLGSIQSENVVSFFDYGICPDTGVAYLAMEYLHGVTLEKLLDEHLLTLRGFFTIVLEILKAFEEIHAKNIIHRDFKPENVMCDFSNGRVKIKLLDFGASLVHGLGLDRITKPGETCGTPVFMAPEQIMGHEPDRGVDYYALGVLMFRVVTGRYPFISESTMETFNKHLFKNVPCPRSWWALKMPVVNELTELIEKLLVKDSERRLTDARAIRRVLLRLVREDRIPKTVKLDWVDVS